MSDTLSAYNKRFKFQLLFTQVRLQRKLEADYEFVAQHHQLADQFDNQVPQLQPTQSQSVS